MFFSHENNYNHIKLHVAIALSAVAAMASLANFFFGGVSETELFNALSKMEAFKAGGNENWTKIQQLYTSEGFKKYQGQQIDQTLQKFGGTEGQTQTPPPTTEDKTSIKTLSTEQIKAIKANAYIEGKDTKFLIVEYTDPECPFCVRQFKDNTINTVMNGRTDISHIIKVVKGVNHANTEYKSLATICGGKLKGDKGYYTMFNEILGGTQGTFPQFTLSTNNQVITYAEKVGIKKEQLNECMQNNDTKSIYEAYRQEAVSLEATGTPGNIIINTQNGKYIHLAGAYPANAFTQALAKIQ